MMKSNISADFLNENKINYICLINSKRFPVYIFIPPEFVQSFFINERKIPTNEVLDARYLGERLFSRPFTIWRQSLVSPPIDVA